MVLFIGEIVKEVIFWAGKIPNQWGIRSSLNDFVYVIIGTIYNMLRTRKMYRQCPARRVTALNIVLEEPSSGLARTEVADTLPFFEFVGKGAVTSIVESDFHCIR